MTDKTMAKRKRTNNDLQNTKQKNPKIVQHKPCHVFNNITSRQNYKVIKVEYTELTKSY